MGLKYIYNATIFVFNNTHTVTLREEVGGKIAMFKDGVVLCSTRLTSGHALGGEGNRDK